MHKLFLPLAGHILDRVAYLVYDAELDRGLGKGARDSIRKALDPVNTGDEDILDSSVLDIRKDAGQKLAPPSLLDMYMPKSSFLPSKLSASTLYMALVTGRLFSSITL